MDFFKWLMIANIVFLILIFATSGKVRIFFIKLEGILFLLVIITAGVLIHNGTLRN